MHGTESFKKKHGIEQKEIHRSRGLRRGSAVARLMALRVQTSPGHACISLVSVVCCPVSGRNLYVGLITSPE